MEDERDGPEPTADDLPDAAFFELLAAPAGTEFIASNAAGLEHSGAATQCSDTRHTLGSFVHHVILFPGEAEIEPKLGETVIGTYDKAEPIIRAAHVFSSLTMCR